MKKKSFVNIIKVVKSNENLNGKVRSERKHLESICSRSKSNRLHSHNFINMHK